MKRVQTWILPLGAFLCVFGYLGWMVFSRQPAAHEAGLHLFQVTKIILDQASHAAMPAEWNLPVISIGVWIAWLMGISASGTLLGIALKSNEITSHISGRWVINFALGFVLFSLIQLGVGLIGFARVPLIPFFFIAALAAMASRSARSEMTALPRAIWHQFNDLPPVGRVIGFVAIFLIAMMVIPALTPPVQSDGMRYHLGAPQEFLKQGAITYLPHNAYSNMPFVVEMHFMGALACKVPEASQLMHLTLAILAALGIYAVCLQLLFSDARIDKRNAGINVSVTQRALCLLPALVYLGTPMSAIIATWPFTDHGISFFLMASIIVTLGCADKGNPIRTGATLGIIAGGLIGTKYTMAPVALLIILAGIGRGRPVRPAKNEFAGYVVALVTAGLIGGVWYLKNIILTGNPFYPLLSGLFPGGDWSAVNDKFLHARAGSKGMGTGLWPMVAAPWNATFHWLRFEAQNPASTILLAALSIICGLLCRIKRFNFEAVVVGLVTATTFVIWFFTYQSNRLLLPTLAAALAMSPIYLPASVAAARRIYIAATTLAAAIGFAWAIQWSWIATALSPPPLPYLLGEQDSNTYRYHSLTYARAFDYLNRRVQSDEKALLIGEHRIYSAQFHAIWSDWFDVPALAAILRKNDLSTTGQLITYLRSHKIDWIMINEKELAPQLQNDFRPWFTAREWEIFETLRTISGPGFERINLPPGATILHLSGSPK